MGALACLIVWAIGVWRFVEGETLVGPALILLAGSIGVGLWGIYNRDAEAAGEGVVEAILQFIHWGG